ncbi:bromodomain adjacent to zinc finger domain protein 1A isoform X2 [Lampris incognitus]|uniref:bromodomain adjacent to zinc finger domain protein 1A isoform X2 n=1 Tax=Lampris incognitus TaxID=2546036 RepID=UPI0024B61860|nr:bromodomain adjacent to zinc finger domain protein 1A isoform X2 [Lampris incognitus]
MPLLHRKPFARQKPPADLSPDEEVFLCKITQEIFRTYDEFFERTILCNSLVWSCALTGKAGLTYLEAVESEKRARQSLQNFPSALVLPLLHLVALTHRCRLTELCEDIYTFVKDRFFPGEMVDVAGRSGARQGCEILEVQSPNSNSNGAQVLNGHTKSPAGGDTIVISDSDEDSSPLHPPRAQVNGKKKSLNPSAFRYKVRMLKAEGSKPFIVKAAQISRKKNVLSRERLKLLFKQHCEPQFGTIALKPSTVVKYNLVETTFSHFFPDEPPHFPCSPPAKGRGNWPEDGAPGQLSSSVLKASEEKLKLMQQKDEMIAVVQKAKLKREKEDAVQIKRREKEDKERLKEEHKKRFEEEKQKRKEEKERIKQEKEREREKLKEEKKKYAERLKLWNKPREDMECDDLKELPCPAPVQTRLPANLFGDALMVLEFLRAFGDLFDLKDEFPEGLSLEVLEEALVGCDPEGPLCELLFFFLTAIFLAQAEEQEEVAKEQLAEELSEVLDDDTDPTQSAISAVASLAAAWPQLHQGCSLKQLDLDSCTLSEILRLHILASGADCNHSNAKFRYQKQGGFVLTDDPCVELRLEDPALLKKLTSTTVYDLNPEDKLKILHALCGKLLTLVATRELIEDSAEEQRAARHELRDIKAEQHRREREEAAHRVRLRKEEKLREQELRLKEKVKEQQGSSTKDICMSPEIRQELGTEDEEQSSNGKKDKNNHSSSVPPASLTAEELKREQDKVRELQERIQKVAACTYILPLGRDRLYRRYWLFPSTCALFVEEDYFGLTEDMLLPQPAVPQEVSMEEDTGESVRASATPVHAGSMPVNRPNRWAFFSSAAEVEQLIEALNPRGHRENALKEALLLERDRIQQLLNNTAVQKYNHQGQTSASSPQTSAAAESFMETRLRDLLLDVEDRIYQGTLGTLKVMDRAEWREALEGGHYELLSAEGRENGGLEQMETDATQLRAKDRLQELKGERVGLALAGSGCGTPQAVSSTVRCLAQALGHVEQGIERKFLKPPLGDEESKKDQKHKKSKKREDDQMSDADSDSGRVCKTVLERWRESLLACTSLSQVFVHLSTLEKSVIWAKSLLNTRCKICRKKGDADNMLLCDGCDRGHHTHCLRPRLKAVPVGDWFCPECRPKQRSRRLSSHQHSSVNSEEENSEAEKQTVRKSQTLVKVLPRSQQATPKNPSGSTGKTPSASKSSGKKAPPSLKTTPVSTSKAPPRAGSRTSARLSHEVATSSSKMPPAPTDTRKRPLEEDTPSPMLSKPVLPIFTPSSASSSSSCSSTRRSSGRNQGVHELSACEQLTVELVRHQDSWPFMKLVSRTQVPDYYDIIKKPMALSTIREKVNNCEYKKAAEFIEDVDLMFSNCLQYNPRHTNEAKAGQRLQTFFHSELSKLGLGVCNPSLPKRSRL